MEFSKNSQFSCMMVEGTITEQGGLDLKTVEVYFNAHEINEHVMPWTAKASKQTRTETNLNTRRRTVS